MNLKRNSKKYLKIHKLDPIKQIRLNPNLHRGIEMSEKQTKTRKTLKELRDFYNKSEMKPFLNYRAKDGSSVQIFRPKMPETLKRVSGELNETKHKTV